MPIILSVTPDLGKNPWSDLPVKPELVTLERIGFLPKGTTGGLGAIIFQATVDGKPVCFQTSWRNLVIAVAAFVGTHGIEDDSDVQVFAEPEGPKQ